MPKKLPTPPNALPPAHYGARLRAAREKRGLTQTQVADALGFNKSTINSIEKGRGTTVGKLAAVAQFLEVPWVELQETTSEQTTSVLPSGLTRPVTLPEQNRADQPLPGGLGMLSAALLNYVVGAVGFPMMLALANLTPEQRAQVAEEIERIKTTGTKPTKKP